MGSAKGGTAGNLGNNQLAVSPTPVVVQGLMGAIDLASGGDWGVGVSNPLFAARPLLPPGVAPPADPPNPLRGGMVHERRL